MKKIFLLTSDESEFENNENTILYSSEIEYNNNQHMKYSLNYLFNITDKYYNDNTKYNFYFDGTSIKNFEERLEEHKKISNKILAENYKKCRQQLFYINLGNEITMKKIVECYEVLVNSIRELEKNEYIPKVKFEYYVLHLNQEMPHFHRIFVIE